MKQSKQCPHVNIVQVGNPGLIETFCTDCNEKIKVMTFGLPYGNVDSHGDVILHGSFKLIKQKYQL